MRPLVRALLVATLATGCGSSVDARGGFDVDALPLLNLIEVLRVGSVDDPDAGFSSVNDIDIDGDGNLFVLEGQAREVRVFDPTGRPLAVMGGAGSGPGEFTRPVQMGVVGDTVWVIDISGRRTTLFSRDGVLIGSIQATPISSEARTGMLMTVSPGMLRPDGRYESMWGIAVPSEPMLDTIWIPRVVFDTTGAVVDTLGFEPFSFADRGGMIEVGGQPVTAVSRPSDWPLRTRRSGDFVIVDRPVSAAAGAAEFTLTWLTEREDTLASQSYSYTPQPFDNETIDSLVMGRARFYEQRGLDVDAVAAALRDALELPAFQSPISAVHLAADGSVWLAREADFAPKRRWIVIGPDGTPRGAVELDRRASYGWADANVLWVIEIDELDIPWVVKYRIEA